MTDKSIAEMLKIGQVTFSRWKRDRPELYDRIKRSYECEEVMNKIGISLDQTKSILRYYKIQGEKTMETLLKEKVLIEESASHLISNIGGTALAEAGVWSIKVDDVITFVEDGDVFVDEDGDKWIKSGTNIVPLKGVEEEISVSMSLAQDQLDAVYNLFDDNGLFKTDDED